MLFRSKLPKLFCYQYLRPFRILASVRTLVLDTNIYDEVSMPRSRRPARKHAGINSGPSFQVRRPLTSDMNVTMVYAQDVSLNPGSLGSMSTNIFRLSSIHDPDQSGLGHQPMGHDQFEPLFERYQVSKVDWTIMFAHNDTNNIQRAGFRLSDKASTSSNPIDYLENGMCQYALLSPSSGGNSTATFSGSVNLCDLHGITMQQYMSNDDYGAPFGSNPIDDCFLMTFADGIGIDTGAVTCSIVLTYHVRLMGSKLTAQS